MNENPKLILALALPILRWKIMSYVQLSIQRFSCANAAPRRHPQSHLADTGAPYLASSTTGQMSSAFLTLQKVL